MKYENKIGIRVLAFIIDGMIIGVLRSFLLNLGIGVQYVIFNIVIEELTFWQNFLLLVVYYIGFAIFNNGITIGKMVLGLQLKTAGLTELPTNRGRTKVAVILVVLR